jgi:hypothetical protein
VGEGRVVPARAVDPRRSLCQASTMDFGSIPPEDAAKAAAAIARGESFHGYIATYAFDFILRNVEALRAVGALEGAWLDAYILRSHFQDHELATIKAVFDACDPVRLRAIKPIDNPVDIRGSGRVSLFRGCAGPEHRMGMSWTASLDKAIWYAAHKAAYYGVGDPAVYATTASLEDVYCRFDRNEEEFILLPSRWWRVDVPVDEFRLDRAR